MKFKESARSLIEEQLSQICQRLEQIDPSPKNLRAWDRAAELSRQCLIYSEALEYIDSGMSPEEFAQKTCQFCANDFSNTESVQFRSWLLLEVIDFEVPGEAVIEETPTPEES